MCEDVASNGEDVVRFDKMGFAEALQAIATPAQARGGPVHVQRPRSKNNIKIIKSSRREPPRFVIFELLDLGDNFEKIF